MKSVYYPSTQVVSFKHATQITAHEVLPMKAISLLPGAGGGGGEGRGEQRRGLRTKALMRVLGTRLECRQRVFERTGKTLWK